jgi:PKD repeat protein
MRIIDPDPYPDPWPYPENQPPVANAWASPTGGPAPLTVQFSSGAYDPDGWIIDYYWDFGDGGWAYEPYPVHTYYAPGTYTAWLSVTDDGGLSAWAAVNVTVTGGANLPPQVTAVANPASGYVPLNVGFQASASDPDGFIASYFWSFGDGGWSSAAAPTHAYGTPGTYTASVTVTDNLGATATSSVSIQALPAPAGSDADGDLLPDGFETSLADAFTPIYHVSAGEQYGTGFARFGDYVPMTIIQNLPAVPPLSHYRVTPVGITYDSYGRQLGFLEIDYFTLWNRDDGLQIGGDCRVYASILGGLIGYGLTGLLDGLQAHALEEERSAALVAAPTVGGAYNTDLGSYAAYSYYTAAHEGTFFDHSLYFNPSQPVAPYNHLLLGLSRAKHGTYPFNPDYYPLFPDWVIFTTYITIEDLYWFGWIDDYSYLIYLYMADTLFYSCVVEHFQDQGGWIADPRINVGELSAPLNGSGFINDPKLRDKLSWLLWRVY